MKKTIMIFGVFVLLILPQFLIAQTSPEEFLGHKAGADRKLADYTQIQAAIDNGLLVENVIFSDGSYLDIGTPADLVKAVRENPYADIFE